MEDKKVVMKLKENNLPYTLTFSVESQALVVNVSEDESIPSINYTASFSLSDLVKQS